MNQSFNFKTASLGVKNWIAVGHTRFFVMPLAFALTSFALSLAARAQDGDELNGNTAEGHAALHTYISTASSASDDTAIGDSALYSDTTGQDNTATGSSALFSNTTGNFNTANGASALNTNTTGSENTATGSGALTTNTTGSDNTATGFVALDNNTTGNNNTATGFEALLHNNADNNTATGFEALFNNSSGFQNTATGYGALFKNTVGNDNTVDGAGALGVNTTGNDNTASGFDALARNTTGSSNIALGFFAGINLTTGSNNIDVGAPGVAAEANTIRIGKSGTQKKTFVAGIHGATVASGVGVIVGTSGQLGTVVSSARFKEAIKPMDKASEAILSLKPVTFRYKKELDPDGIAQFGLVAEEVEKVNPDLVAHDEQGQVYTVRYEAVNAMLLNEFIKEHKIVEELKSTVARQEATIAAMTVTLNEQASLIRTVSDQLEASKSAPKLVANN